MKIGLWRKIHKWIFIFLGMFMLMWLSTAILMVVPKTYWSEVPTAKPLAPDYRDATISPAQALDIYRAAFDSTAPVKQLILRAIGGDLVYLVRLQGLPRQLISASSGQLFNFTGEMAKTIVRQRFADRPAELRVERHEEHSTVYPYGGLPVYLVSDGRRGTVYIVDPFTGNVRYSSPLTRARNSLVNLHDFSALGIIFSDEKYIKIAVLAVSTIGILGAMVGYYLALPRRKR